MARSKCVSHEMCPISVWSLPDAWSVCSPRCNHSSHRSISAKAWAQGPLGGQEDVVAGALDGDDGGAIAEAARPTGDLPDVENGIGGVDGRAVAASEMRHLRAKDQRRHSDIEAAVQLGVPAPDRTDPAEGDGEAGQRLPVEVVVPLAVAAEAAG